MSNLFSIVLNMSMTGSVVILLVMLARLILKQAPKIFSYALWSVVLFRLLCPVSFTAPVSILNPLEPEVQEASESTSVVYFIPAEANQNSEFTFIPAENQSGTELVQVGESENTDLDLMTVASDAWIVGTVGMILYSIVQYILLRRKLVGAMLYRGDVYLADYIDIPFVMGVLQPKIYLPSNVPTKERKYIITHERHHVRRFDHIIKLLAYLALSIHWFNPLAWVAFILAGKDMEMSCDEAVIRKMGPQIRADYSASLLRLATHKKIIAGMPLAFGEGDTKGRVMNMAKWKKPKLWVSLICMVLCAAVLVACAVNPDNAESTITTETQVSAEIKKITLENDPLPQGYFEELDGDGNIIFTDGINTVGGVMCYVIPEGKFDPEDEYFDWLAKLGIPDYEDSNLVYLGGITSGDNGWAAEFADNSDDEANRTVYRRHTFQVVEDTVYDIWFDLLNISFDDAYEIRRAVNIPQPLAETVTWMPTVPGSDIITDTQLVQYGSLKLLLPSGFSAREQDCDIVLTKDSVDVGGITCWNHPGFEPDDMIEWMKALGIPELQENFGVPIGYMAGSSAYGGLEIEIFQDGNPEALNEEHVFFIDGSIVYDVWYDQNLISDGVAERFLKTVAVNTEPASLITQEEQEALDKCNAVIDAVQSGSHHIAWEKSRTSSSGSSGYRVEYLSYEEDWLHMTTLETGNGVETQYRMKINGESSYGVLGFDQRSNENAKVESELPLQISYLGEPERPWLASYQWDDANVAYVDTLQDQGLEIIMLRIDEPFYGYPEDTVCYWVDFVFDGSGNFLRVELEATAFRNNDLWSANEVESILSLDPERVNVMIQSEYDRFNS